MSQINLPLDIASLEMTSQGIDSKGNIIIDVVSKNDHSACPKCGKPATKLNGKAPQRLIRHLSILDKPVYWRITPVRYMCENCDDRPTTTEQCGWCARNASTTHGLEEYLMRNLIHSTIEDVAKKESIGAKAVQNILDRQVNKQVDWPLIEELEGMMWILRKQHECLSKDDKEKLELLYHHSPKLKQAHHYALRLTQIFNTHCSRKSGMAKIKRWIESVEKNELGCFNKFIVTLKKIPAIHWQLF